MSQTQPRLHVVFVCTGNTCRSPLAALALQSELGDEAREVRVGSAGTAAAAGEPASEGAARVARAEGFDLSGHRASRLTPDLLRRADLVFVMSPSHRAAVEALGGVGDRIHVLSEWPAPGEPELPVFDPFGASFEAYEECWRRIVRHVRRIAPHVREALRERRLP